MPDIFGMPTTYLTFPPVVTLTRPDVFAGYIPSPMDALPADVRQAVRRHIDRSTKTIPEQAFDAVADAVQELGAHLEVRYGR